MIDLGKKAQTQQEKKNRSLCYSICQEARESTNNVKVTASA